MQGTELDGLHRGDAVSPTSRGTILVVDQALARLCGRAVTGPSAIRDRNCGLFRSDAKREAVGCIVPEECSEQFAPCAIGFGCGSAVRFKAERVCLEPFGSKRLHCFERDAPNFQCANPKNGFPRAPALCRRAATEQWSTTRGDSMNMEIRHGADWVTLPIDDEPSRVPIPKALVPSCRYNIRAGEIQGLSEISDSTTISGLASADPRTRQRSEEFRRVTKWIERLKCDSPLISGCHLDFFRIFVGLPGRVSMRHRNLSMGPMSVPISIPQLIADLRNIEGRNRLTRPIAAALNLRSSH